MDGQRFCALDVEGSVDRLIGCAVYSDTTQTYSADPGAITALLRAHAEQGYTFIAHQAEYELAMLWEHLELPFRAISYQGRFCEAVWRYAPERPAARLWCTARLSGIAPLSELGAAIALPKLPTPQRLQGKDPDRYQWLCDRHQVGECVECYCLRDAEIAYQFIIWLQGKCDSWCIPLTPTQAGLVTKLWHQLDRPEPIALTDRKVKSLARAGYFGARTEVYKPGHHGTVYRGDLTWAYVAAMLVTPYPDPAGLMYFPRAWPSWISPNAEGVAECTVQVPAMYSPPLPWKWKGERVFPIGRIRGTWTLLELRHAQSLGVEVLQVHRLAQTTQTMRPAPQTLGALWELREQYLRDGSDLHRVIKGLGVALYGRWGMDGPTVKEEMWLNTRENYDAEGKRDWDKMLGHHWFGGRKKKLTTDGSYRNVLWAAQTTAAVRVMIHRHMLAQGQALAYVDTDAIWSLQPIAGLGEGLGQLKAEPTALQAVLAAPKAYRLTLPAGEESARVKGLPTRIAAQYLQQHAAEWQDSLKPLVAARLGQRPGQWTTMHATERLAPARRHPTSPSVLQSGEGWSDSSPWFIGDDGPAVDLVT